MTSEPTKNNNADPNNAVSQSQKKTILIDNAYKEIVERKRTLVNRVILLILLIAGLFVLIPMIRIFLTPLLLSCTFASLFFPFYKVLLKFFRGNRAAAALICCVSLVLGLVAPTYFLGYLVTHQLFMLYQSFEPTVQAFVNGNNTGLLAQFSGSPVLTWLTEHNINWQNTMLDVLKTFGATMAQAANKTSLGALEVIVSLFVTLFIMFYFFMDGESIVKKFRQLLPMRTAYQDMIITRFLLVSRATVKGTLVIAFIQGSLGAIILLAFGVKAWLLWGVVMIVLGLIPMMGTWPVLVTAGIIQMATGHMWQGLVILALNFGVVSTIDNVLRPRLVGRGARMHDLLIFFSTIGGLAMFGPIGVVTGPVIMAFFVSITEIYTIELKEHLNHTDTI